MPPNTQQDPGTDKGTGPGPDQASQEGEPRKEEAAGQGYPPDTPVAEMTLEQQVAYWKQYSRKHESESKETQTRLEKADKQLQEANKQLQESNRRADLAGLRLRHPHLSDDIMQYAPAEGDKLEEFAHAVEALAQPDKEPEPADPKPADPKPADPKPTTGSEGSGGSPASAKADALAASSMSHQGGYTPATTYEETLKKQTQALMNQRQERNNA